MPALNAPTAECRRPPFLIDELVLELVNNSSCALGAYEIAGRLSASGRPVKPAQAYRALHRLVEDRQIGKIEGLNAYCSLECGGPVIFCRQCRRFTVLHRDDLLDRASEWAAQLGFEVRRIVAEVGGTCPFCSAGRVQS